MKDQMSENVIATIKDKCHKVNQVSLDHVILLYCSHDPPTVLLVTRHDGDKALQSVNITGLCFKSLGR